jgi:thymidylate synthase (FAD)
VKFYTAPQVTLLSMPSFLEPAHLPVEWLGLSTNPQRVAEYAGRICYMSQANPAGRTSDQYLANILTQGHGSVLEHGMFSYLIEGVSRALTHELIRHRVGTAVSQLSQRYVDAADTNFVIPPALVEQPALREEYEAFCRRAVDAYADLVANLGDVLPEAKRKQVREAARAVLPNGTETKLVWSCNLRELRHVLLLRGSSHADAEIQQLALALLEVTRPHAPAVLADLVVDPVDGIISTLP